MDRKTVFEMQARIAALETVVAPLTQGALLGENANATLVERVQELEDAAARLDRLLGARATTVRMEKLEEQVGTLLRTLKLREQLNKGGKKVQG